MCTCFTRLSKLRGDYLCRLRGPRARPLLTRVGRCGRARVPTEGAGPAAIPRTGAGAEGRHPCRDRLNDSQPRPNAWAAAPWVHGPSKKQQKGLALTVVSGRPQRAHTFQTGRGLHRHHAGCHFLLAILFGASEGLLANCKALRATMKNRSYREREPQPDKANRYR